jgi:hypothetical protein
MSRLVKVVMPSVVLIGGFLVSSPFSFAKPDYMKKEQKACIYCHNAPNKRDLNAVGKCYAEHGHSLDKCDPKRIAPAVR